jgi:Anti-sigma factor NepR
MNATSTNTDKTKAPDAAAPDPKALEAIGRALKAHYADLVQAPLPEKFAELLAKLEAGDRVSGAQGSRDAIG